eukprot:CAMPEP_0197624232 /NCGR_PEP_ID=MMETSP1338-20131121/3953_1 /TAXON_ID=43686 ORGANISM="Pelagodinium beii, Strain RCC1491" /NCGR_SAMPLE_ID=MMETSP1338 /ASSEMBLY_ACC=CAM_ASM_000754 /LENGTH=782 /DNA_ID=CAMNT_0043194337 /DNA_START=154 /DNA_END=2502 /DNA_ORIENTATION=-
MEKDGTMDGDGNDSDPACVDPSTRPPSEEPTPTEAGIEPPEFSDYPEEAVEVHAVQRVSQAARELDEEEEDEEDDEYEAESPEGDAGTSWAKRLDEPAANSGADSSGAERSRSASISSLRPRSSTPSRQTSATRALSRGASPELRPSSGAGGYPSSSSRPPRPSSAHNNGASIAKSPARPPVAPQSCKSAEEVLKPKKKLGQVLFNASHSNYEVVAEAAEGRGWKVVKSEEKANQCNVHWIDDSAIGDWMRKVEPWMRINHFPGMNNALARKTRLARNMARMQRIFPAEYRFIPPTWVVPDDFGSLEKQFGDSQESKAFYIVKPDHLCQGRGIFLTTDLERLRQVSQESRQKNEATVVQRYITRPMLIEGLKFDLRLYFLVAAKKASDGNLDFRLFLFRDGLVRLCTQSYQPPTAETVNDKCMHLTNYAVNKNSKNFVQNDGEDDGATGSKRSLRWFMSYIEEQFGPKERQKLWLKLMGLCVKTVLTVSPTLEAEYDGAFPRDLTGGQMGGCRCFEVLGIDVMLDAKRKPYLIEVNHLPSFTCDSPLDDDIKRRLVNQIMDLTCEKLTGKDNKIYDQLVKERRERNAEVQLQPEPSSEAASAAQEAEAQSLLDLPVYKDFERAYPPPDGAPKLAASFEAIMARVKELFKPVHLAARRKSDTKDAQDGALSRPPLPPKGGPSSVPKADTAEARRPCLSNQGGNSPRAAGVPRPRLPDARKRSRSAPGPPRCALPPISRQISSPRLNRCRSPTGGEEGTPSSRRSASAKPTRVLMKLKSAQILL